MRLVEADEILKKIREIEQLCVQWNQGNYSRWGQYPLATKTTELSTLVEKVIQRFGNSSAIVMPQDRWGIQIDASAASNECKTLLERLQKAAAQVLNASPKKGETDTHGLMDASHRLNQVTGQFSTLCRSFVVML